jgi:hypothetical protein
MDLGGGAPAGGNVDLLSGGLDNLLTGGAAPAPPPVSFKLLKL